jgi:hypothetical protein
VAAIWRWGEAWLADLPLWAKVELLQPLYGRGGRSRERARQVVRAVLRGMSREHVELVGEAIAFSGRLHEKVGPDEQVGGLVADAWSVGIAALPGRSGDHVMSVIATELGEDFDAYLSRSGAEVTSWIRALAALLAGKEGDGVADLAGAVKAEVVARAKGRGGWEMPELLVTNALRLLLHSDPQWEGELLKELSAATRLSDGIDLVSVTRTLLEAGADVAVWGELVGTWLEKARDFRFDDCINAEWQAWLVARRDHRRSPGEFLRELLSAREAVATQEDFAWLARHADERVVLEPLMDAARNRKTDQLRAWRARWVASGIVKKAERMSPAVILAALMCGGSWGLVGWRAAQPFYRLARLDREHFERTLTAMRLPKAAEEAVRAAADPCHELFYEVRDGRLRRCRGRERLDMKVEGRAVGPEGVRTYVALFGVGTASRLEQIRDAYATDVLVAPNGEVVGFTGRDRFYRSPGRVRPLRPQEVEMIRRVYREAAADSSAMLAKRTQDVSDLVRMMCVESDEVDLFDLGKYRDE